MFHREGKKTKTPYARPLKDLTAMLSPAQLLSEGKRGDLLKSMQENSALEPTRFDSLCLNLIQNLIHHCQRLPETSNRYYALPGGLVDHALNRTEAALTLFRQFVVQDPHAPLSEEQKLWLYALFSAGILKGVGKLQLDYRVELFDANGQLLKPWNPLLENMTSAGRHYAFEFLPEGAHDLRCRLNILLARMLMPTSGFAWIISNPEVLAVWLALLSEDARGAGTLSAILIRADAIAIQRYFNENAHRYAAKGGRSSAMNNFVIGTPESITDKERALGLEFLKWLTQQIESGRFMVNKAPLLAVPGGLFMTVESFQLFVREHPEYKNWLAVQNAFLSLGVADAVSRTEHNSTQEMHDGVTLTTHTAAILPEQVKVHHNATNTSSTVSSITLLHALQSNQQAFNSPSSEAFTTHVLSATGSWQTASATVALGVSQRV